MNLVIDNKFPRTGVKWVHLYIREHGGDLYLDGEGSSLVNNWITRYLRSRCKLSELIFWMTMSFIAGFVTHAIWVL